MKQIELTDNKSKTNIDPLSITYKDETIEPIEDCEIFEFMINDDDLNSLVIEKHNSEIILEEVEGNLENYSDLDQEYSAENLTTKTIKKVPFPKKKLYQNRKENVVNVKQPNTYSCATCHKSFKCLTDMAFHRFIHIQRHECPICGFQTKSKPSFKIHLKRHEGKFNFTCEICGKGFFSQSVKDNHMEIHEDIPKYECEYCNKRFTVKKYLHVHKVANHKKQLFGVEESFQCEICGRNFTFEKSLVRHLSVIHLIGESRRVECNICHKIVANNYNLKKHMRTHTGEKRFCCDICGKAFAEKKYWRKHLNVHSKEEEKKNPGQHDGSKNECVYISYLDSDNEDELLLGL